MTTRAYDAVLCDLDGVLRHWPPADDLEKAHGLPAGALGAAAFAPARLDPAITGAVTDEEWRAAVARDLARACGSTDRAQAAVVAWARVEPQVDHEVVALLARARTVATVALLSNATTRLEADLARQGLDDVADIVISTACVGFAKPDPRVFLVAAELVDAPPGRCLFVDDTAAHVTAARAVGMTAVRYRRFDDLRDALAPLFTTAPGMQASAAVLDESPVEMAVAEAPDRPDAGR